MLFFRKKIRTLFCLAVLSLFAVMLLCSCAGSGSDDDLEATDTDVENITNQASNNWEDAQTCDDESDGSLPRRVQFSEDGLRLVAGLGTVDDFYEFSTDNNSDIKRIDLSFSQDDWWTELENNYESETEIAATMTYDGEILDASVGVRFKGFTSYQWNNTEKKSFNISIDYDDSTQDLDGYNTLNLNCAWGDETFMREVIYEHINQHYIPAVSVNYVELYINGEYWGLYINSQQIDNNFIKEWFTSTNGTRWRAEAMGSSALTYVGDSVDSYTANYSLKRYCWSDPWDDLINVCYALENTPSEEVETEIPKYLDLDRALWFIIMENLFADEDGYINKGGMDYYIYWNDTTGLLIPLEYDGNTTLIEEGDTGGLPFSTAEAGPGGFPTDGGFPGPGGGMPGGGMTMGNRLEWTPFQGADQTARPLIYKLLNVPSIRQRYLAHMRTVLNEYFNETYMDAMIDAYASKIEPYITTDPKTFITDFSGGVQSLKDALATRCTNLWSDDELNTVGLAVSDVKWIVGTVEYETPSSIDAIDEVIINATVEDLENGGGINTVYAYLGEGIEGPFSKVEMYDDGTHGDGVAGDGVYGVMVPEGASGVRTRFYIEAVAGDTPGTRTYSPAGAEHDVFTYQVDG